MCLQQNHAVGNSNEIVFLSLLITLIAVTLKTLLIWLINGTKHAFALNIHFLSSIQAQLDVEAEAMRVSHKELLSVDDIVYMPDKDTEPVNRTLIQKAGYLNIRK